MSAIIDCSTDKINLFHFLLLPFAINKMLAQSLTDSRKCSCKWNQLTERTKVSLNWSEAVWRSAIPSFWVQIVTFWIETTVWLLSSIPQKFRIYQRAVFPGKYVISQEKTCGRFYSASDGKLMRSLLKEKKREKKKKEEEDLN